MTGYNQVMNNTQSAEKQLPETVLARWSAEDWDADTMTASHYTYETENGPIELTEAEADQYTWGRTEDNITGGCQRGCLVK